MNNSYDALLSRLIAYRKGAGMDQQKMSEKLQLTQSHYSKLERGEKLISYDTIMKMEKEGMSMDLMVTGNMPKRTILNELLEQCPGEKRAEFFKIMVWGIRLGMGRKRENNYNEQNELKNTLRVMEFGLGEGNTNGTVWNCIRENNGLTQENMAKELDIGIKRYREIEKGNVQPNAEILTTVYEKLGYPPSLIIQPEKVNNYLYSLNQIWLELEGKTKDEIVKMLKDILTFIDAIG